MIAKNPINMSNAEIVVYLNSGRYIPSSTRQQLENKLGTEKKLNKFSGLDEFFAMVASNNLDKNKNIDTSKPIEEFPMLGKVILDGDILKTDFSTIFNSDNFENKTKFAKPLFIENNLVISYNDIQKMYNRCAIYRIYLQCALLNKKIYTLNKMESINSTKGKYFKHKFRFDVVVDQELKLKKCMNVCIKLKELIFLFKNQFSKIFTCPLGDKAKILPDKINICYPDYKNIEQLFVDDFSKYHPEIKQVVEFIENVKNNLLFDKSLVFRLSSKYSDFNKILIDLNNQIVNDYDPHIFCDYHLCLISSDKYPIIEEGLSFAMIYLSCRNNEINFMESKTCDLQISNRTTENEFKTYFETNKIYSDNHFIHLNFPNSKPYFLHIYYRIKEIIPESQIFVKIIDLPPSVLISTSTLHNYDFNKNKIVPSVPLININKYRNKLWLNRVSHNNLYKLNKFEYESLDPSWKKYYSYGDVIKNNFAIEYLFNDMLIFDKQNILIKPNMLNSFKKMATKTSTFTEF